MRMLLKFTYFSQKQIGFFFFIFLISAPCGLAQIYEQNFGNTTISAHPYTGLPTMDSRLSNASWSNSVGTWTSNNGASGQAIRLTTATASTITFTFTVAPNFQASITAFDFWRQRSNFGPQNWTLSVNGIVAGSGSTPTSGSALGNSPVSNPITGLTGTNTLTIALSGSSGNGNFLLDDFKLFGSVISNCASAAISSVFPNSGPQNTLVTINGSGFTSGGATTAVKFNGINANGFTVVSDTEITAYLPAGNTSGSVSVSRNGCEGFSPTPFTSVGTILAGTYSTDIYISELYDAQRGDGGVIEIYNGTASTVNLSGYTLARIANIGGPVDYTVILSGSVLPGGIYLIGIGSGTIPCGWDATQGQRYTTGFNANDEFKLFKNGVLIDHVQTPSSVGYTMIRNPNAIAPKAIYNANDWNQNSSSTETCANIGMHNVATVIPPAITSPVSKSTCAGTSVSFSAPISNPAGYNFQWKTLDLSGAWVNVPNANPYSNANTNTLTINPTPANFDNNQYYCQMTSGGNVLVSNTAQLEITAARIPDFPTTLNICNGDAIAIGNTSPNGISGTWNAPFSNTIGGTYTFTPTAGQCAQNVQLAISIRNVVPDFPTTLNICNGDAITIGNTSPNGTSGNWNAAFSNTIGGTYTFTPTTGQCAQNVQLVISISNVVPDFPATLNICNGDAITIGNTSPNGISGTWNVPFSNTIGGTYTFTPTTGQCAQNVQLAISIRNIVPDFPTTLNICNGDTITIGNTAPNGISGTWNVPFSNTIGGTYTFTPTAGQCAQNVQLVISISNVVPDFPATLNICNGDAITIGNTSPNGISGTWNVPFSNTIGGTYTFTPTTGQCAQNVQLAISIRNIVPDFPTTLNICNGDTITIGNTAPNGISGTWNAPFSNTIGGTYTFTPTTGQCAQNVQLVISIRNVVSDFPTTLNICNGDAITIGNTSPNGISGNWNAPFSNTIGGTYTFTPTAGQCAQNVQLVISISNIVPDFPTTLNICNGDVITIGNTSPNGISGTWNAPFSNTVGGTYTFTPTAGQCAQNVQLVISIRNVVPDFPTTLNICNGDAITIGNISPNGISGNWNAPFNNTIGGTYTFTPTAGQCAQNVRLSIAVITAVTSPISGANELCIGNKTTLGNAIIGGSWISLNPNIATVDQTGVVSGISSGTAKIIYRISNGNCNSEVFKWIAVNKLPKPVLKDATICIGPIGGVINSVTLDSGMPDLGFTFIWTHNGLLISGISPKLTVSETGDYSVLVTNNATGCSASASCFVGSSIFATATVDVSQDFALNPYANVQVSGGSGNFEFRLNDGVYQQSNIFYNLPSGESTIYVNDINGCSNLELTVYSLQYPRFFTPNGDGYNDSWNISGLPKHAGSVIQIFDRYGKLIKTLNPSNGNGWDGTFNGASLPGSDYWFTLIYYKSANQPSEFSAHFSLKR